jgi:hypothetical protein
MTTGQREVTVSIRTKVEHLERELGGLPEIWLVSDTADENIPANHYHSQRDENGERRFMSPEQFETYRQAHNVLVIRFCHDGYNERGADEPAEEEQS